MGSPGPPAKTQGFRMGQEWLVPTTVGQWYAGLNWAGGAGAVIGMTIVCV